MHKFPIKGKGKKGGGPKPIDHEKNRAVLDLLLPLVSNKIDENGGVMRVSDLSTMKDVRQLLSQVPPRCPKTLPLILTQWSDFFVNMANGLVGTATGYETGMITEDGTLDPAYESMFADTAIPYQEIHAAAAANQTLREAKPLDLTEAADCLWRCALNLDNDAEFKAAFKAIENARKNVRGSQGLLPNNGVCIQNAPKRPCIKGLGNSGAVNISDAERCTRKEKILHRIVEILSRCPNQTKNMCLLVSDPTIRELKKGAVSKFLQFLQEFPNMLKIVQVEGIPQYNITLLDRHVPIIRPMGGPPLMSSIDTMDFVVSKYG